MNELQNDGRLIDGLQQVVRATLGPDVRVENCAPMADGHAGLTFGFTVTGSGGSREGDYVLRLAPPGVTRRGNTDVYRQAPLIRALHDAGLPVPAIRWASPEEMPLGSPYIVMEKLPGRVFLIWEPHESFGDDSAAIAELWRQAAATLARVHRLDWRNVLRDWEQPQPLSVELRRWDKILRHAQDPAWLEHGLRVQSALLATEPHNETVGLVHGDFQPGNMLYDGGGRLVGVIDWELASIGAQGLDVGWLLLMGDPSAWSPTWRPVAPLPPSALLDIYREAGGPVRQHLEWFQAFAAYRMASIACLNVKLHRTGKRPDPLWEHFATAIPYMFRWAEDKLATLPPNKNNVTT